MGLNYDSVTFNLAKCFNKSFFWGITDAENVRRFLFERIKKCRDSIIHIDLQGIHNLDPLFVELVFVKLAIFINTEYHGNRLLILNEPENDEIDFSLHSLFKKNGMFIVVEHDNLLSIKGWTSYIVKVIFHKLLNYSPIAPEFICKEIRGNQEKCLKAFAELSKNGIARLMKRGLYISTIRGKGFLNKSRSNLKQIKLFLFRKPFIHLWPFNKSYLIHHFRPKNIN